MKFITDSFNRPHLAVSAHSRIQNHPGTLRKLYVLCLGFALVLAILPACKQENVNPHQTDEIPVLRQEPDSWMFKQRSFPDGRIRHGVIRSELRSVQQRLNLRNSSPYEWQSVGPVNIGGRITALAGPRDDTTVIYAGTSVGGLFRSSDAGETWQVVFEKPGAMSIGDVAVAESDTEIIYLGTGESNGSSISGAFFGDGMYRSDDGGLTWQHKGLTESHHIGRIAIDPDDPQRVFVAATGHLYGKNEERGIYRSHDSGDSWEKVLYISDSTACIDLVMHPVNHDTLYCSTWERLRYPHVRSYAGPTSGVYRSYDGGDTWEQIATEITGEVDLCRIGIAISDFNPARLYMTTTENPITNVFHGFYMSDDNGDSWMRVDDGSLQNAFASFGWFFGNVRVEPGKPDEVYVLGLYTHKSYDGGTTWEFHTLNDVHVDQHALLINPLYPAFRIAGNDGGIYKSDDSGGNWQHNETMATTMFYTCTIDPHDPDRIFGGAQDNGTLRKHSGIADKWEQILGGDGFNVIVDPLDSAIIFAETQWGGLRRSTNGGANWAYIPPVLEPWDRTNWNTPIALDLNNPETIYYGSSRLYRSDARGLNWYPLSNDLTNQDPNVNGGAGEGSLSTIAIASHNSEIILVGTDDGNVQFTKNGGVTWELISANLPVRYVTKVAFDPHDVNAFYVTLSGYRDQDYLAHVLRTADQGLTWLDISAVLPEVPVNDIIPDPHITGALYVATDMGVWQTNDFGSSWEILGEGMPLTIVTDLDFDEKTRTLAAATYGRSMYTVDLSADPSPVQDADGVADCEVRVYPNPATDRVTIELPGYRTDMIELSLIDRSGRVVYRSGKQSGANGRVEIDLANMQLPAGLYVLTSGNGACLSSTNLIIQ